MTSTEQDAAGTRVQRSRRRQRVRWRVTPVVALLVCALLPLVAVTQFRTDDHLRRTQPVVDAVVTHVRVTHGKHARVTADVATPSGQARVVGGGLSTRHPPAVGEHLPVVVDPAHRDHALLATTDQTLGRTLAASVFGGLVLLALVLLVGWGIGFPLRSALRAARRDPGTAVPARVRSVHRCPPPQGRLFAAFRGVRGSSFAQVELDVLGADGGERLSTWYLVSRRSPRPGDRVHLVGTVAPGGWACAVDRSVRWPYAPLSLTSHGADAGPSSPAPSTSAPAT